MNCSLCHCLNLIVSPLLCWQWGRSALSPKFPLHSPSHQTAVYCFFLCHPFPTVVYLLNYILKRASFRSLGRLQRSACQFNNAKDKRASGQVTPGIPRRDKRWISIASAGTTGTRARETFIWIHTFAQTQSYQNTYTHIHLHTVSNFMFWDFMTPVKRLVNVTIIHSVPIIYRPVLTISLFLSYNLSIYCIYG